MPTPDENDKLRKALERLLRDIDHGPEVPRACYQPVNLWDRLAAEGNWPLIEKLRMVEEEVGGYGTVVCPPKGFSDNDETHNAVVDWLQLRNVNVVCPDSLIKRLFMSLHG